MLVRGSGSGKLESSLGCEGRESGGDSTLQVLLANPPTYKRKGKFNRPIRFPTYGYATPVMHPPLLLAYAAAYIRSRRHEVELIDAEVDSISVEDFISRVEHRSPDYIVFETSTASFKNDVEVAREIKEKVACKVAFVGPHVSALPVQSMQGNSLDAVIVGEYELSLCEYIEKGPDGTKGVCYRRDDGKVIINPPRDYLLDLDQLPFPARDLIPNYKYFDPILKNPFTFVLSGRGCPYRCTFCNWPQVMTGRRYRLRSAKNVVDELEVLQSEYQFKSFLFNDDTFTADKRHAMAVCDEMIRRRIRLPWICYARADINDRELLEKLKEAGCWSLKVGVESANQKILDNVKKQYKIEKVVEGINLMKSVGLDVHCTYIFGLPGETVETIKQTIEFSKRLNCPTVQFSTAVPFPGTELHRYLKEQDYLLTEDWEKYMPMQPIFEYPHLSAEAISDAVKIAYRGYYFRPKYIRVGLRLLLSQPKTVLRDLRGLIRLCF